MTPARYPDIHVYPGDLPLSWQVTFRTAGALRDVSGGTFSASVVNNGTTLGDLGIDSTGAAIGRVVMTLDADLAGELGRYSTWSLRESVLFDALLVVGRVVKESW